MTTPPKPTATPPPTAAQKFARKSHGTEWLRVGDLVVHWPEAQRALAEKKAKELADNFNPDFFGTLTVSPLPNGHYHVDDGWHRRTAVQMLYGDDERVPCTVVQARNAAEAAEIFVKMNGGRTKPNALDMFEKSVTAEHPVEVAILKIVKGAGLNVSNSSSPGQIRAVTALMSVYKAHGAGVLGETLTTIRAIWGLDAAGFDAHLIRGFAMFLAGANGTLDRTRLAKRVAKKFTPGRMIGSAKATCEAFGGSMTRATSALIAECYGTARGANRAASS